MCNAGKYSGLSEMGEQQKFLLIEYLAYFVNI